MERVRERQRGQTHERRMGAREARATGRLRTEVMWSRKTDQEKISKRTSWGRMLLIDIVIGDRGLRFVKGFWEGGPRRRGKAA